MNKKQKSIVNFLSGGRRGGMEEGGGKGGGEREGKTIEDSR